MKYALLTPTSLLGIFWLVLLFLCCFFLVHGAKLIRLGRKYQKQKHEERNANHAKPTPEPKLSANEKKTPTPSNQGEPIYYIVERKHRKKPAYSEPKRIRFK
jgi:hypothetical protein